MEEVSLVTGILFNIISILAIIISAVWLLYKFIVGEKPSINREIEAEKHLKSTYDFKFNINSQINGNENYLTIQLIIKNVGKRIGIINRPNLTIKTIKLETGGGEQEYECINVDDVVGKIELYPDESISICYLSPALNRQLLLVEMIMVSCEQENGTEEKDNIEWKYYFFYQLS